MYAQDNILCQFGLFRHKFTTVSPPILNHFWWELYQLPMGLEKLGGLGRPLDHCWGQLDSILGHLVPPQSYGGLTIVLDCV